jgi:hypothetical protein
MGSWKTVFGSYLKQEDLQGKQARVVIGSVVIEEIQGDNNKKESKPVAHFVGKDKGLVLNKTICAELESITGTDDIDNWGGTPVILFVDPNVMYGGKKVGGIRVKAVAAPAPPPPPPTREPGEDDITADDVGF